MLAQYSSHRPGLTIRQNLMPSLESATSEVNACVVGPKYLLNRYGHETIAGAAFNAAGQTLAFQRIVDDVTEALDLEAFTVDEATLKLYGVGLHATLATFTAAGTPSFIVPILAEPNVIKITNSNHVKGGSLATSFRGRPVAVGDVVYAQGINGGTAYTRTVVGLRGVVADGTFGADTAGTDEAAGNVASNPIDSTSSATQVTAPAGWTVACANHSAFAGLGRGAKNITEYGEEFSVTVHTAGTAGTRQVETATVAGTIGASGAGNATVIVTAAGLTGSPLSTSVAVANNDTAAQVAGKIRTALGLVSAITSLYTVGGSSTTVSLTKIIAGANDATLNISVDNGTCTGLTAALTSANTTAGSASVATVNIGSASGLYSATNVATTTAGGEGTFTITSANAGGELAGVTLLITPPGAEPLSAGMSFRIRVVGAYTRLDETQAVAGGAYTGAADTTYMVRVATTNSVADVFTATVDITDTAGIDDPQEGLECINDTDFEVGSYGLTLKFVGDSGLPQTGLRVGDVYYIHAKAGVVSTTNFDTVVLDGPAVDTLVFTNNATELYSVAFRLPVTAEIAADDHSTGIAWTTDGTEIVVTASLANYVSTRDSGYEWCAYVNTVGELQASYRAAYKVTAGAHGLEIVNTASDLVAAAGANSLTNPLGYAAAQALTGAQGAPIYVLNTGGSTIEDYTAALTAVESTRLAYGYVFVDSSDEVMALAKAHVVSASSEENRNHRHARFGLDSPGRYAVLTTRTDTTNFTATVSPHGGGFKLVTIVAGSDESDLLSKGLVAGDLVLIDGVYYPIASVPSDTELLLSSGPASAVDPAAAVQVWKEDTVASQILWLKAKAEAMADRRVTLCWSENPTASVSGVTTTIPVMFAAAYMSGLRSYLPPQVGLTRQPVPTLTAAAATYSRYSRTNLDEIASYGITIFSQDNAAASVRIRHQATTDTSDILNFEESTTVRLDVLSQRVDAVLDDLVGRINTTEQGERLIRSEMLSLLDTARQVSNINSPYGPLIDNFTNLVVARSSAFLDRVDVSVVIELGPPTNRIAVELTAYARIPAAVLAAV